MEIKKGARVEDGVLVNARGRDFDFGFGFGFWLHCMHGKFGHDLSWTKWKGAVVLNSVFKELRISTRQNFLVKRQDFCGVLTVKLKGSARL